MHALRAIGALNARVRPRAEAANAKRERERERTGERISIGGRGRNKASEKNEVSIVRRREHVYTDPPRHRRRGGPFWPGNGVPPPMYLVTWAKRTRGKKKKERKEKREKGKEEKK